ncbi:XrtA-associated ATPase [Kordiimonas sp. SCSIO 12603]|uniref:XrtA/PEP-CTERM system-associated ATPase n=1 Tax=Kordiimonas sp. SCSIO 12603 TaxID=2829596 RepID=UPI00210253FF|nr:XrtA/PEP-CTERM system-associated ATPase [Kordiimonas sp. SCSIO 12603]UTW57583.1 XrtA-associated ATPase [Kordiimonas sp. SCSIO 12603]
MYESFYNLQGRPFQLTPDPRFYFSSRTHKKAMAYLSYGLNQGEGFIIVTGDIGTGKTTLVRHLFDTLDRNEFIAAMIVSTQLSAEDLLRSVVAAFGLDAQADDKGQLLSRLERHLREQYAMGRRALLVVDEAQNLSNAALEEMRMLSNFQEGDKALIQSFLVGQPEFRERIFAAPELEQLRQRVIATHHLEPMEQEELAYYIEHRLRLVGWDNDPCFTVDAVEEIYNQCQGVPRRLNTLCSRVLLYGALEEIHEIDADVIRAVVSDMATDQRPVQAVSSARPVQSQIPPPVNRQNDATIPLEASGGKSVEEMENRMDKLENMMKSQDETLQKLTSIMAQLAAGGSKGDDS